MTRPAYILALDVALKSRAQQGQDAMEALNRIEVDNADLLGEVEDMRTARRAARVAPDEIKEAYRMLGYPVPVIPDPLAGWEKELLNSTSADTGGAS
jgi:hypothetical protein